MQDDIQVHIAEYLYMYHMALAFSDLSAFQYQNSAPTPPQPRIMHFLRMFLQRTIVYPNQMEAIYPISVKISLIRLRIVQV